MPVSRSKTAVDAAQATLEDALRNLSPAETLRLISEAWIPSSLAGQHAALESYEAILRVLATVDVATWGWNTKSDIVVCDGRLYDIFGVSANPPATFTAFKPYIHPADLSGLEQALARCIETGEAYRCGYRVVREAGEIRYVQSGGVISDRDELGNATVLGVCVDETRQRIAEQQKTESLQEVLDAIPAMSWIVREDKRCTYISKSWLDYTGRGLADSLGFGWTKDVHPDDREAAFEAFSSAFDRYEDFDFEYRIRSKDGRYRWFLSVGRPRFDGQDKFLGYAGSSTDIDDQKLQSQALERFADDLEQFNHLASHDLKEPVRTVLTFCSELREDLGPEVSEPVAIDIGFIEKAGHRMRRFVEGFHGLSVSRRAPLVPSPTSIAKCVQEAESTLAGEILQREAQIETDDLPTVWADEDMLTQVFQNLIGNAIKCVQEVEPRVVISSVVDGDAAVISVHDNGPGIPLDKVDEVFRPFERLQGRDENNGAGMGLAFCRTVIERHGGKIWVDTASTAGCRVSLRLPLTPAT